MPLLLSLTCDITLETRLCNDPPASPAAAGGASFPEIRLEPFPSKGVEKILKVFT